MNCLRNDPCLSSKLMLCGSHNLQVSKHFERSTSACRIYKYCKYRIIYFITPAAPPPRLPPSRTKSLRIFLSPPFCPLLFNHPSYEPLSPHSTNFGVQLKNYSLPTNPHTNLRPKLKYIRYITCFITHTVLGLYLFTSKTNSELENGNKCLRKTTSLCILQHLT